MGVRGEGHQVLHVGGLQGPLQVRRDERGRGGEGRQGREEDHPRKVGRLEPLVFPLPLPRQPQGLLEGRHGLFTHSRFPTLHLTISSSNPDSHLSLSLGISRVECVGGVLEGSRCVWPQCATHASVFLWSREYAERALPFQSCTLEL